MSEPLFDQSFYDYFAEHTHKRLTDAVNNIQRYRTGALDYPALVQQLRLLLHNLTGEARMLGLPDIGRLTMRLSHRLGRLGTPVNAPLGPVALQHLTHCCELLAALVRAETTLHDRSVVLPRQAFMQELLKLEAAE